MHELRCNGVQASLEMLNILKLRTGMFEGTLWDWGRRNNMAQKDICFRTFFEMHPLEFNKIYEEQYFKYFILSIERSVCERNIRQSFKTNFQMYLKGNICQLIH